MKPKEITNNHTVNRQREKKNLGDILGYAFSVIIFLAGVVYYIYPNVKKVDIMYEIETIKKKKKNLVHVNSFLKLEVESLKRLDRIEKIAKGDLGLVNPAKWQIVYVR